MTIFGAGLIILGSIVVVMGILDLRWGNTGWRTRLLTGLLVASGGVYFLVRG